MSKIPGTESRGFDSTTTWQDFQRYARFLADSPNTSREVAEKLLDEVAARIRPMVIVRVIDKNTGVVTTHQALTASLRPVGYCDDGEYEPEWCSGLLYRWVSSDGASNQVCRYHIEQSDDLTLIK